MESDSLTEDRAGDLHGCGCHQGGSGAEGRGAGPEGINEGRPS